MLKLTLYCMLLISNLAWGNRNYNINIQPTFNHDNLQLNHYYNFSKNDSIQFTNLKFYISNIAIFHQHKLIYKESNSYHLIDYTSDSIPMITLTNIYLKKISSITFDIGIDSMTNVSGALGGDLDPTKGMYWSWQSGYINFKLEGNTNLCPLNNHFFEYHIGGYTSPNKAIQQVSLTGQLKNKCIIEFKLDDLCKQIDFATQQNIMSPSTSAVQMSRFVKQSFSLK